MDSGWVDHNMTNFALKATPETCGPLLLRLHRLRKATRSFASSRLETVLNEKRNYWRKERAKKVSYVIDAAAFFKSFYEAALRAEKQIIIVGWDTDSRVELIRGHEVPDGTPVKLKDFLFQICEARPDLRVYILSWDFTFIYSLEREKLPQMKFEWLGHPRVRFVLDGAHPALGSHHQKIVVIDDQVAFSGGLDITARRWDTPEHKGVDERRVDPWGKTYGPFHDVQVAVEGEAARALGDLVRERWKLATGETLEAPRPPSESADKWPPSLDIDAANIDVAISRTIPAMKAVRPVYEVERLFIDSIARAKRFIFFENQYFSSKTIAKCLARRLSEPDGPEVVMILPRDATGWIEESTMTVLRGRALDIVRAADKYGRFRVYHPVVPGLEKGYVKVHSKVTVIDDEFARIGSANLNQRSMGLDTECDISFEAEGRPEVRKAIASLRARLLGEHLDVSPDEIEARFERTGSLLQTVESLRGKPRTLIELERRVPEWLDIVVPHREVLDPSGPYRIRRGLRRYFPYAVATCSRHVPWLGQFKILTLLAILATLFVLWEFTPFREWVRPSSISALLHQVRSHPLGPLVVIGAFIVGGFVMVPVTALIVATALTFDAFSACMLALGGTMASASLTFWLGSKFKSERIATLSNRWLSTIKDKLAAGGWLAVAVVRTVPVAPFTVVNLVAGSVQVPFRDFVIGTFVGSLPGILALTLLADRIGSVVKTPDFRSIFLLSLALLTVIAALKWVRHFFSQRTS